MRKFFGFTLAEVLITLTIIGVVAAMTIPNLQQKYTEHVTVNKVKKFYTTLSNAYSQAVREYGPVDIWQINDETLQSSQNIYDTLFKPYFKIARNCGNSNKNKCISEAKTKLLNGRLYGWNYYEQSQYYKIILEDGLSVWFQGGDAATGEEGVYGSIYIGTSGLKGTNTWGKDIFGFKIKNNKVEPSGLSSAPNTFDNSCANHKNGFGCAAWLIYKGNMDYLHCKDLKWNGKQKCTK